MFKALINFFSNAKDPEAKRSGGAAIAENSVASLFVTAGEALDRNDLNSAFDLYSRVVQLDPDFEKARVMLGFLYKQKGNLVQAKIHLARALEINPSLADANYLLGSIAAFENNAERMVECFLESLAIDPQQEHLYLEFSYALFQMGRFEDAISQIKRGLERYPEHVGMLQYLGNFYLNMRRHRDAFTAYEEALRYQANSVDLLYNFVICCMTLFEYELALEALMRIQKIQPDHLMANFEEGMLRLQRGEYERGWQQFEWRWKTPALAAAKFKTFKPKWDGTQSLDGRTILIRSEQGFGDTLQFCRFIPVLKKLGARVVFSTQRPLLELMQQIEGVDSLLDEKLGLPDFDYYCELMSLPLALKNSIESIPLSSGYLKCPPASSQKWGIRIVEQGTRRKIGVVWSGNPLHTNNHMRSISFASILPLFDFDADFTVLQKELSAAERAELGKFNNVFFYGDEVEGFSDTAGLVEQMELVITVDTSVAHLSGAMAKPTWVLISCFPDWRWLLETEVSPWYDSVRLFRQGQKETWDTVIQNVKANLARVH